MHLGGLVLHIEQNFATSQLARLGHLERLLVNLGTEVRLGGKVALWVERRGLFAADLAVHRDRHEALVARRGRVRQLERVLILR